MRIYKAKVKDCRGHMLGKRNETNGATYRDKRESNNERNCRSGKKSKKNKMADSGFSLCGFNNS